MKTLNLYLLIVAFIINIKSEAQDLNTWRISFGYSNFSKSDDLLIGNQYTNFNNFNFPNTLSIEKRLHNNFSFKFSGIVNEFERLKSAQALTLNQKNDFFLGLDLALKYSLMGEKGKSTWFNPFISAGIGYSKFGIFGDTKLTAGFGSNFWVKKNFGIQISSTYNKSVALDNSNYLNNFIGFIVLFNKKFNTDFVENNTKYKNTKTTKKESKPYDEAKKIKNKEIEQTQIAELKKIEKVKFDTTNNKTDKGISSFQINIKSENDTNKVLDDKNIKSLDITTSEKANTNDYTSKNLTSVKKDETITSNSSINNEASVNLLDVGKSKENLSSEPAIQKTTENNEIKLQDTKTEKVLDSDHDKVPDEFDKCPTVFGEPSNGGCPKKTELTTNNKTNPISTNQNISDNSETNSKVSNNDSILKVTNIYFETNDAKILDDERSKINMIIYIMEKNPNSKILIEGHTAKDGDLDYNKKLSENRAKAVRQYLISKGINHDKIETKSLGSTQPVTTDRSEKAKAMNRRARIILLK